MIVQRRLRFFYFIKFGPRQAQRQNTLARHTSSGSVFLIDLSALMKNKPATTATDSAMNRYDLFIIRVVKIKRDFQM